MRRTTALATVLALLTTLFGASSALAVDPERLSADPPSGADGTRLEGFVSGEVPRPSTLSASLLSATGTRQVVVQLNAASVGSIAAEGGDVAAQQGAIATVEAQQDAFLATAGGRLLGRTRVVLNAVILEVDGPQLLELAANPAVASIRPLIDYELALDETVPYIGATAVQAAGFDGSGVSVAVLDSGLDYTHAAFGGPGTAAAYNSAYGANTGSAANKNAPTWPAAGTNIVDGFDFVGEEWPFGDLAPDPDPIDCGGKPVSPQPDGAPAICDGGHGTHVADIIGGTAGVAPGVDLYAVKVCSVLSTACSGVAILEGMDFALDPDGDGDTSDRVDVINMSLGADYGTAFDNDLSQAVEAATALGVLTAAAAGNGSDKPYVGGTPAAAPSAISVAQTQVPSAQLPQLEVITPAGFGGPFPAVFQEWSAPLVTALEFRLFFDDSTEGRRTGCRLDSNGDSDVTQANPFEADDFSGMIVLVERGLCTFSEKIANIALAGGEAGLIGLITPEEPFEGALGDCPDDACDDIPGFMIHQNTSERLRSALASAPTVIRIDPAASISLAGYLRDTSSRGPTMGTNLPKPEIGAPGASVSAEAGTGTDSTAFSGTSGATPMIAGSAALMLDAFPGRSPAEIKSLLMNYAETDVLNLPTSLDSDLAPITRIGNGEVRVNNSYVNGDAAAWDTAARSGALGFGFVDAAAATTTLTRSVTVRNYSGAAKTFSIASSFRFASEAGGAVSVGHPPSVVVPATGTAAFDVTLTINGSALRDWILNSGDMGANGDALTVMEYDGYLTLSEAGDPAAPADPLHLAWHVLPRLSGDTTPASSSVTINSSFGSWPAGSTNLSNDGVGFTNVDGFSWIGQSGPLPEGPAGGNAPVIDLRYAGVQTIPTDASDCTSQFRLRLAVNTWERQTHANAPAAFEWDFDINADGTMDYAVFNLDLDGEALTDGRNAVFAQDLATFETVAFFFTDHATNSANTVLTICGEQIGLTAADIGRPLTADLLAVDWYSSGLVTDEIPGMQFAAGGERYFPVIGSDGFAFGQIPPGGDATLTVIDFGADATNSSELGVLLFTDGEREDGAGGFYKTGAPQAHEALAISVIAGNAPFGDINGHPFEADIVWAWENGITAGCSSNPPLFCPDQAVNREQMASFLVRAYALPPAAGDHFTDDESSIHEADINAAFEAGLTVGCGGTRFCPTNVVLREQMASFLVRAEGLPPASGDHFTDDEASVHESDINRLFESGITTGCGGTRFCPTDPVTRGQMTAFLHRALD